MLDGTLRQADTAIVHVESLVFSRNLECLCAASPICDVIVGNVPGATDSVVGEAVTGSVEDEQVNVVTTRAQLRSRSKSQKPLMAQVLSDLHVSAADMEQMQKESGVFINFVAL